MPLAFVQLLATAWGLQRVKSVNILCTPLSLRWGPLSLSTWCLLSGGISGGIYGRRRGTPGITCKDQISSFNFSITASISSFVLCLLKEKRTVTRLGLLFSALMTWLPTSAPLLQALPPEAPILFIARLKSILSDFSVFGKADLKTV